MPYIAMEYLPHGSLRQYIGAPVDGADRRGARGRARGALPRRGAQDRAPRPQAREPAGGGRRAGEDRRLRGRARVQQGRHPRRGDRGRDHDRHARLHVARAGARWRSDAGHRPLLAGRGGLGAAHRAGAVRRDRHPRRRALPPRPRAGPVGAHGGARRRRGRSRSGWSGCWPSGPRTASSPPTRRGWRSRTSCSSCWGRAGAARRGWSLDDERPAPSARSPPPRSRRAAPAPRRRRGDGGGPRTARCRETISGPAAVDTPPPTIAPSEAPASAATPRCSGWPGATATSTRTRRPVSPRRHAPPAHGGGDRRWR